MISPIRMRREARRLLDLAQKSQDERKTTALLSRGLKLAQRAETMERILNGELAFRSPAIEPSPAPAEKAL